jgi:hypothetical protein
MGRPKSTTTTRRLRVNIMLEPELREELRDLAVREDRNFSDQLNRILRDYFRENRVNGSVEEAKE